MTGSKQCIDSLSKLKALFSLNCYQFIQINLPDFVIGMHIFIHVLSNALSDETLSKRFFSLVGYRVLIVCKCATY